VRSVNYTTHWSYAGPGVERSAQLIDFVLDILYLMDSSGIVPPFHVLNEVLQEGGSNGGMSPGTSWQPFEISDVEYQELVEGLLKLDIAEARNNHPYVRFERVIVDKSLNEETTYADWMLAVNAKYPKCS
jgi:hypothetical protein